MTSYDTLYKDDLLVDLELAQFQEASQITIDRGIEWLLGKFAPNGPILDRHDLALIYKTLAAMALVERSDEVTKLLDWVEQNAVASNGDLYFEGEEPSAGVYRQSWLLRNAAQAGHSLAENETVKERMRQYQMPGGAVSDHIGEDPAKPEPSPGSSLFSTCGYGLYAIAAGDAEGARKAGEWLVKLIERNGADMERGEFFFIGDEEGNPDREVEPGGDFGKVVRVDASMQPTWVLGIAMAFLADLYDSQPGAESERFLDAAATVSAFQDRMPVETYFSWNACKHAWSSGRMLDVCIRHGYGDIELYDKLYRAGRRTYVHTFLATRRDDGSWGHDFYPPSSDAPEVQIDHRVFEGISATPSVEAWTAYRDPEPVIEVDAIEVSGENLVLLLHLMRGFDRLREHLGSSASGASSASSESVSTLQ